MLETVALFSHSFLSWPPFPIFPWLRCARLARLAFLSMWLLVLNLQFQLRPQHSPQLQLHQHQGPRSAFLPLVIQPNSVSGIEGQKTPGCFQVNGKTEEVCPISMQLIF